MKTITTKTLYTEARSLCRRKAGVDGTNYPVEVVEGNKAPELVGCSYHHLNKSGRVVHYPNAYRRAYGNPIYVASTLRVEVGAEWLQGKI